MDIYCESLRIYGERKPIYMVGEMNHLLKRKDRCEYENDNAF